ncbi:glycosyltransferase family 4 protein [Allorhizobium terrae]|uniref:Glycosyltransferase family 4 protein n=1 Tax=Allorhizobium terrae TaxID=1848972 RepID=A0A4S3ZV65_9HYPH|nr:glycosyltransferase family 4 protein [Allorhizobium terrae]THF49611.1 glycosyltransferase family 4 protein [Allorhizobium terrae]
MSRDLTFAFPGRLELNTGGYIYDRRVIAGLSKQGWAVQPMALGEGFPFPTAAVKANAEQRLSALPDGSIVLVDGLAFGVLDDWAKREAKRLKIVALVHHPLALETGLSAHEKAAFHHTEMQALQWARHVIVTSPVTARELTAHFKVNADTITVAIPGVDAVSSEASPSSSNTVPHILSVGTLTPRKGHDILLAALKQIEDLPWQATIIGSRNLHPQTVAQLEAQQHALGLGERVVLAGEVEFIAPAFEKADIFALASRYEGYGMVFAEALAHGLPVIACHAGAVSQVVPEDAGILVPVDDVGAFAKALRNLLQDTRLRQEKAEGARRAGAQLPTWDQTSQILSNALESVT